MAEISLNQDIFEIDYVFSESKEPTEAFNKLSGIFQSLYDIDKLFLLSINSDIQIFYTLESLEYSSIRTWIAQRLRDLPDEAIKNFDWKKLVGHFLLKLKYLILKYLEENQVIETKKQIEELTKSIESEKTKTLKNEFFLINEVNIYFFITAVETITNSIVKLRDNERLDYKSIEGNASVSNKVFFNKQKILWEFGDKQVEGESTEVLKIRKLDLLSNDSPWNFKLGNRSINAKITDLDWLTKYHSREFPLLPEDSLRVKLKVSVTNQANGKVGKPTYEITKVIETIYPNRDSELPFQS